MKEENQHRTKSEEAPTVPSLASDDTTMRLVEAFIQPRSKDVVSSGTAFPVWAKRLRVRAVNIRVPCQRGSSRTTQQIELFHTQSNIRYNLTGTTWDILLHTLSGLVAETVSGTCR